MPDRPWWQGFINEPPPTLEEVPLAKMPDTLPETPDAPPVILVTVRDAIDEWINEEQSPSHGHVTGWPTIDSGLDRSLRAGEVILLAARTGVGKTWGLQTVIERCLRSDLETAAVLHEMEMPAYQIAERIVAHATGRSPRGARRAARDRELTADTIIRQHPYLERLLICERSVAVDGLGGMLEASRQRGVWPTILAVDYFGLLAWTGNQRATLYERASENARRLKQVAVAERILILVAAQLSRGAGDGTNEPELNDLRDSGVSEEAADRVLMFWRDPIVEEEQGTAPAADSKRVWGKIAKNRFGPTGFRTLMQYDHSMTLDEVPEPGADQSLPY